MLLQASEKLILELAAFGLAAAILLLVAETPAYPIALGVVLVAFVYIMLSGGGAGVLTQATNFINKGLGGPQA
jgi:hypothetical protein